MIYDQTIFAGNQDVFPILLDGVRVADAVAVEADFLMLAIGCIVREDTSAGADPEGAVRVLQQATNPLVVGKRESEAIECVVVRIDANDAVSVRSNEQFVFFCIV